MGNYTIEQRRKDLETLIKYLDQAVKDNPSLETERFNANKELYESYDWEAHKEILDGQTSLWDY